MTTINDDDDDDDQEEEEKKTEETNKGWTNECVCLCDIKTKTDGGKSERRKV